MTKRNILDVAIFFLGYLLMLLLFFLQGSVLLPSSVYEKFFGHSMWADIVGILLPLLVVFILAVRHWQEGLGRIVKSFSFIVFFLGYLATALAIAFLNFSQYFPMTRWACDELAAIGCVLYVIASFFTAFIGSIMVSVKIIRQVPIQNKNN